MGFNVVNKSAPDNPSTTDRKVKYSYTTGWDLAKYLYGFQITFLGTQTYAIIANIFYHLTGNWISSDVRITDALNEFRKKLGLPESKQCPSQ